MAYFCWTSSGSGWVFHSTASSLHCRRSSAVSVLKTVAKAAWYLPISFSPPSESFYVLWTHGQNNDVCTWFLWSITSWMLDSLKYHVSLWPACCPLNMQTHSFQAMFRHTIDSSSYHATIHRKHFHTFSKSLGKVTLPLRALSTMSAATWAMNFERPLSILQSLVCRYPSQESTKMCLKESWTQHV